MNKVLTWNCNKSATRKFVQFQSIQQWNFVEEHTVKTVNVISSIVGIGCKKNLIKQLERSIRIREEKQIRSSEVFVFQEAKIRLIYK